MINHEAGIRGFHAKTIYETQQQSPPSIKINSTQFSSTQYVMHAFRAEKITRNITAERKLASCWLANQH